MINFPISIRSMTAYGEASSDDPACPFQIIIQSVNRRFLELNFQLPHLLEPYENELRKWAANFVFRGHVTITILMKPILEHIKIHPNLALAREIKKGWEEIAKELNLSQDFPITLLSQEKDLFFHEHHHEKIRLDQLEKMFKEALKKHQFMREEEGYVLKEDMLTHLDSLKNAFEKIDLLKDEVISLNKERLQKKALELFENAADEKVLREIAFLSEKFDINEEIVRFRSLYAEFYNTLVKPLDHQETKGKKLEFLLQELSREINTLGSKSQSFDIAKLVVEIKSELEKIREQMQNIE